ncbi:MAG: amidohydrolase [Dehalococcoidales bacterium]|nr:amidohydrolase [Dehalococcoidales bacterium]
MPKGYDVHVHVPVDAGGPGKKVEKLAAKYASLDIFGNILGRDSRTVTGDVDVTNDYVAAVVKKYPNRFAGIGSVDPWLGKLALYEAERAVKELGLKGLKFEPYRQEFFLNDKRFYPLWEKIQELGVPIMVHTGTIQGMGTHHLEYNKPIPYIDDVASDFPGLTIIACHPSFPWQDETLAIATYKKNVYIELSAGYPKDFSDNLVKFTSAGLQDKVMFGSGYPLFEPEEWIRQFKALPVSREVQEKVLLKNATKFFRQTFS